MARRETPIPPVVIDWNGHTLESIQDLIAQNLKYIKESEFPSLFKHLNTKAPEEGRHGA